MWCMRGGVIMLHGGVLALQGVWTSGGTTFVAPPPEIRKGGFFLPMASLLALFGVK